MTGRPPTRRHAAGHRLPRWNASGSARTRPQIASQQPAYRSQPSIGKPFDARCQQVAERMTSGGRVRCCMVVGMAARSGAPSRSAQAQAWVVGVIDVVRAPKLGVIPPVVVAGRPSLARPPRRKAACGATSGSVWDHPFPSARAARSRTRQLLRQRAAG
jgi:hypothetical protein